MFAGVPSSTVADVGIDVQSGTGVNVGTCVISVTRDDLWDDVRAGTGTGVGTDEGTGTGADVCVSVDLLEILTVAMGIEDPMSILDTVTVMVGVVLGMLNYPWLTSFATRYESAPDVRFLAQCTKT